MLSAANDVCSCANYDGTLGTTSCYIIGASSTGVASSGSENGSGSSIIVGVGGGSSSTAAAEQSGAGGGGKGSSVTTSTKALSTEVTTTSAPAQFTGAAGRFKAGMGMLGAAMVVAVAL